MRTTVRLDDALLRRAKAQAAAAGRSLNDFIADAVQAAVMQRSDPSTVRPIPTFRGGGLLPGVDLDDSAALLEVMERREVQPYGAAPDRPRGPRIAEPGRRRD